MIMAVKRKKNESKVGLDIRKLKASELHSGSKKGPLVKSRKQAVAIGLSQQAKEKGGKPAPKKSVKRKKK